MSKDWEWSAPEWIERQRAISGWGEALYRAYSYDTAKLSAYLRRNDLPLDEGKREALADLIDRRIHRKKSRGRKPGRIPPPHPDRITEDQIVAAARYELDRIRKRNGGKVPPGSYRAVLHEIYAGTFEDVEIFNENRALKKLRRGRR
jgi:hypothetical protein